MYMQRWLDGLKSNGTLLYNCSHLLLNNRDISSSPAIPSTITVLDFLLAFIFRNLRKQVSSIVIIHSLSHFFISETIIIFFNHVQISVLPGTGKSFSSQSCMVPKFYKSLVCVIYWLSFTCIPYCGLTVTMLVPQSTLGMLKSPLVHLMVKHWQCLSVTLGVVLCLMVVCRRLQYIGF